MRDETQRNTPRAEPSPRIGDSQLPGPPGVLTPVTGIVLAVAAWCLLALAVALVVGRGIRLADREELEPVGPPSLPSPREPAERISPHPCG
jgi:hypothetical protein